LKENGRLKFSINAKSFTKPIQIKHMNYTKSLEILLDWYELVYDLYTGTGTIAQFVSKKPKK
jgi:23S rRNA (uracil1939-C5)-methyltransferase